MQIFPSEQFASQKDLLLMWELFSVLANRWQCKCTSAFWKPSNLVFIALYLFYYIKFNKWWGQRAGKWTLACEKALNSGWLLLQLTLANSNLQVKPERVRVSRSSSLREMGTNDRRWYNVMIQLVILLTKRRNIRKMCSKCEMASRGTLPWDNIQYINADSIQTKINSIFWSMFLLITPWRRSSSYRE